MRCVLQLDAACQPIAVISIRRATMLLLERKAVPMTDETIATMRSASIEVEVPAVIQAGEVARWIYQRRDAKCSAHAILARDFDCQFIVNGVGCASKANSVDHLLPKSRGGDVTWTNAVGACLKHNGIKANRTLEEMGWTLKREPVAPRRSIRMLYDEVNVPASWVPFLQMA